MNLEGKVIVITGATKGLGKALAEKLLGAKAVVVVSGHIASEVESVSRELSCIGIVADVRKEEDIQDLAEVVIQKLGRIDVWINNAGIMYLFSTADETIDLEKAHNTIETNLFGAIFGCRTALKYMKEAGSGTIINVLSTAALDATRAKHAKIYVASKWGLRGYYQALKGENEGSGVNFYEVYPGGMQTDLFGDSKPTSFPDYMDPASVAEKIVTNLKKDNPEEAFVIKRPVA